MFLRDLLNQPTCQIGCLQNIGNYCVANSSLSFAAVVLKLCRYSRHSLSQSRIPRISGYLEVKLKSRFKLLLFPYEYSFLHQTVKPFDFAFIEFLRT